MLHSTGCSRWTWSLYVQWSFISDTHRIPPSQWWGFVHSALFQPFYCIDTLWWQTCLYGCRLVDLMVKASASRAADQEFDSRLRRDVSESSHTKHLKIGTPVATLPGAWRHRVRAGTAWPGVSILWLSETKSLIRHFCLCVAARKTVWADQSLSYTSMLLGR